MKLFRFGPSHDERPGLVMPGTDRHLDATSFGEDYDPFFFEHNVPAATEFLLQAGSLVDAIPNDSRIAAPVWRPGKIVCAGLNYRDHAEETGGRELKEPVIFLKSPTALSGPFDDVMMPIGGEKLDYEVELALVIGRKARNVPEVRALDFVAGYTIMNDYSERAFQLERKGQWTKGKSCDTFAPVGPYIVTPDEIPDVQNLHMWLTVNGEVRQDASTRSMIFPVSYLVSYCSRFMTLLPGDIIATGTPGGVGLGMNPPTYLKPGDVVEMGIDRLGVARQKIVAYS